MKVLLSSIGSRGDVQPLLALAIELRARGHRATLCVPPNFKPWVESFGVDCAAIGPDVREGSRRIAQASGRGTPERGGTPALTKPSGAQLRALASRSVSDYFRATLEAGRGSDLIVSAGALQLAGRSVAEALKIPYVYTAYCPAVLRSSDHPPPKMRSRIRSQSLPRIVNHLLWALDERRWNALFRTTLNAERARLELPPIATVAPYVATGHPWLAADPVLGPAASHAGTPVTQTGAWLLPDSAPLPDELERFLAEGEPPVYFGFGSMQASIGQGPMLIEAARAVGRRAILARGWAGLSPGESAGDCFSVEEVSHERLFSRVAAVVHHGGAGTTVTAARAGIPQVVVPHLYDQFYWAHRVRKLRIGVAGPQAARLTADTIAAALRRCLAPGTAEHARTLAPRIESHGARIAAERLIREFANAPYTGTAARYR